MLTRSARRSARVSTRPRASAHVTPWERGKLVALFIEVVAACLVLLLGLGLSIYYTVRTRHEGAASEQGTLGARPEAASSGSTTAQPDSQQHAQDLLAEQPMPNVGVDAAQASTVSSRDPGTIQVPASTGTGPAGVRTGFPHTPAGALAQLAAIDKTAMQSGTLAGVRAVIAGWAAPGGPNQDTWSAVGAMASFLNGAGLSGGGSGQLALVVTPLMGLIKGTVGPDFVLPCVDFQFDATLQTTQHVASADCQRMVWEGDRWAIGPGAEPADPPSVWADTDTAIAVGYKDLRNA